MKVDLEFSRPFRDFKYAPHFKFFDIGLANFFGKEYWHGSFVFIILGFGFAVRWSK